LIHENYPQIWIETTAAAAAAAAAATLP